MPRFEQKLGPLVRRLLLRAPARPGCRRQQSLLRVKADSKHLPHGAEDTGLQATVQPRELQVGVVLKSLFEISCVATRHLRANVIHRGLVMSI